MLGWRGLPAAEGPAVRGPALRAGSGGLWLAAGRVPGPWGGGWCGRLCWAWPRPCERAARPCARLFETLPVCPARYAQCRPWRFQFIQIHEAKPTAQFPWGLLALPPGPVCLGGHLWDGAPGRFSESVIASGPQWGPASFSPSSRLGTLGGHGPWASPLPSCQGGDLAIEQGQQMAALGFSGITTSGWKKGGLEHGCPGGEEEGGLVCVWLGW